MGNRMKVAVVLNLLVAGIITIIGLVYLTAGSITSYHKTAIGVPWETVASGVQFMMIVLMRGVGDALLVTGIAIAILTWIPLRQGQSWARWAILTIGLACMVPMLVGAIYVATSTGAASPWWLNAALNGALLASFVLSRNASPAPR